MRIRTFLVVTAALDALSLTSACTLPGVACNDFFAYGITVNVTDADGPLCDAVVTITEGDYSEVLESGTCGQYSGAGERAGDYTILVEAPGYDSEEIGDVVVGEDECHVINESVDVELAAE